MRIIFAADHAGFSLKEHLKPFVESLGHSVEDVGNTVLDEQDDYPAFVAGAARIISAHPEEARAIVIGGSGQGEAIAANRFPNVRAVVYAGEPVTKEDEALDMLALTREHNDANILSLGARFLTEDLAERAVRRWLEIPFSGEERHARRNTAIDHLSE